MMLNTGFYSAVISGAMLLSVSAADLVPKEYTTNCAVCHALDKPLVGPSLVEIAKLYPRKKKKDFVKWCAEPGKKRAEMPVMPSMAHIAKGELEKIHDYILSATKGKSIRVRVTKDEFKDSASASERPRVVRTFLPETGPASMVIALPTSGDHNFIWDTDKCELRYISVGKIDNFPYLRSNGNSLAKVGKIVYYAEPLFGGKEVRQFKGYELSKEGFPTLHYSIGGSVFTEKISVDGEVITRAISCTGELPVIGKLEGSKKLGVTGTSSGKVLTIIYKGL